MYFLSFGELRLEVLMGMCCIAISSPCCHALGNRTANKPDGRIAGFGSIHSSPDSAGIPEGYQGTVDQLPVRVGQDGGFCGGGYRCLTALLCRGTSCYAAWQQHSSRCQGNMILTHGFTLRFLILRQHPTRLCAVSSFSIIIAEGNGSVNLVGVPVVLLYYLYDIFVLIALLYIDRLCI